MISDRDLDVRLAAAAGVRDEDLPALPESFLRDLRDDVDHGAETAPVSEREPASVVAARQLVTDAHEARMCGVSKVVTRPTTSDHGECAR